MTNITGFVKRIRDIMRNDAGINGDAQRIEQLVWMLFLKVYATKEEDWEMEDDDYESIIPKDCRWQHWGSNDDPKTALTGDALLHFVDGTLFPTLKTLPVTRETPIHKAIVHAVFQDANNYMKDGVLMRQVLNEIDALDLGDAQESHAFGEIYELILREIQSAGSAGEFYTPRAVTRFMARMIRPKLGERMADFACGTGGFITSWLAELEGQQKTADDTQLYAHSFYGIEKKQFPYMLCITNMLLHGMDAPEIYHDNALTKNVLDYTEKDQFDVILMNPPYGGSEKDDIKQHFPKAMASSETADLFMALILYRLKQGGRCAIILPDGFLFGNDGAKYNIKKKLMTECNLHTIIRLPSSVFSPYTSITTNILFFDKTGPTEKTWFYRLDMPEGYKHFSKTKPIELRHFDPAIAWWNNRVEIADKTMDTFKAKAYTAEEIAANDYNLDLCGYPVEKKVILSPEETMDNFIARRQELEHLMDVKLAAIRKALDGDDDEAM